MYEIEFSREALRALRRMPRNTAVTIRDKLVRLSRDPHAENRNVTKLTGREGYRLRVGGWRVIYRVESGRMVIVVIAIAPRGGVYR